MIADAWTAPAGPAPAAVAPAAPAPALGAVDRLLRDRRGVLDQIDRGDDLAPLVRAMLGTIVVAAALVGAALGLYRGGVQIAYVAVKLPLVLLLSSALCAPTLTAVNRALGRPSTLRQDVARLVVAVAFGALVMLALAPLLLLARAVALDYHQATLVWAGCFGAGAIAAIVVLAGAVRRIGARDAGATLALVLVTFAMVGAQMAWTLRPYLARPRGEIVFVRAVEGSVADALLTTFDSARGRYRDAPEAEVRP